MTCLVSPAASQPDDRHQCQPQAGGLAITMVGTAMDQLRSCWSDLGFDGAVFLAAEELQSSLAALRPAQRRDLLTTILGLCEDSRLCQELQKVISRGLLDPGAGRSVVRLVAALQPVLAVQLPQLLIFGESRTSALSSTESEPEPAPELQQDIALLGLSTRMDNAVRRNGLQRISDLIGLEEHQLLHLRGVGANGLQELREGLERLGLPFPLRLDPAEVFTPPAALVEAMAMVFSSSAGRWGAESSQPCIDEAEDQRWLDRAAALLGNASVEVTGAQRMLAELTSLTLEHFSALVHRSEELHQLRTVFHDIEVAGSGDDDRQLLAEGLQGVLLEAYRQRFGAVGSASGWLRQLRRGVEPARAVEAYLRHAGGESLQAIGALASPPITREAVRLSFRKLSECCGFSPKELAARMGDRREQRERQRLLAALQPWLVSLGRLPFHTDALTVGVWEGPSSSALGLEQVIHLNLNQRLGLYDALALEVPEEEWALHLRVIANNEEDAGAGYWHREETLSQFLHRYAVVLGALGLMPLQTQLPPSVRGAVQRHGGQSVVASRVGLQYQGQLTGENGGRTYWTERRLIELLEMTVAQSGLAADAMPSKQQITAFLASGVMLEYLDKQPNSVFAALRCQYTLNWQQVGERFGRVWQG
jgi:hypothetical protein